MTNAKELLRLWRNVESRLAFIAAYKDWGVWITTPELSLVFYRYVLPDGVTIIAMEHQKQFYVASVRGHQWKTDVRYFIQNLNEPFTPSSSATHAVGELLKKVKMSLQKNKA